MIKSKIGIILIVVLSLIPIIIWANLMSLSDRFGGSIQTFVSLGQISALLGLTLFSITVVLSTRLKIFDDYFGGMNRVYIVHHFLGGLSFILILFHPLFLLSRTIPISLEYSARFLLPGGGFEKDLGIYSLWLMIILLILTFFVGMKYELWKGSHKFLGVALFLGGAHSMFIYSDIQNSSALKAYMIFILFIGYTAYIYKTILGKWFVPKYKYKVIDKKILDDNVTILTLQAVGKIMPYKSGQFVFINFENKYMAREIHPFSISSDNMGDKFTITIKALGDFTSAVKNVELGEIVKVEGAFGKFNYKNSKNKNQIWIAGGIGVTPFLGMLRQLISEKDNSYNIDFYYCTKILSEQILINDLKDDIDSMQNINYFSHCSVDHGYVNSGYISVNSKSLKDSDIFLCGPPSMMSGLREQFLKMGIKSSSIISEEFKLN